MELTLQCPACRQTSPCACGFELVEQDGVTRALTPDARRRYRRFFDDYLKIRREEGRGADSADYYLALPFEDRTGRLSWQWEMRAKTLRAFERRVLQPFLRQTSGARVLDLGAGVGWLSRRLVEHGCRAVAVDLLDDPLDGLGAARHYQAATPFPVYQAEFDRLPFADAQFDLAVFNASFHYSTDYRRTLQEVRRVLTWQGRAVILDTPVYSRAQDGEAMVAERHAQFEQRYGTRSDSVQSIEFLDERMLRDLARDLNLSWRIEKPWYGLPWHLRPWKARLRGARRPSRFWILEARWQ